MSRMFSSQMLKPVNTNPDISKWDVSRVKRMLSMFAGAESFDGDISAWTVSRVTDMSRMFAGATIFNSDIKKWDVSNVKSMYNMFWGAKSFNIDISLWDVSSVMSMSFMFKDATSFKYILCGATWVHSRASKVEMFSGSPGSISNNVCDRELIAASMSTSAIASACTKCGTFKKSGRVSCCAPGGAWYNNCGGVGDRNVDHSWLEGVTVCEGKSKISGIRQIYLLSLRMTVIIFCIFHQCP